MLNILHRQINENDHLASAKLCKTCPPNTHLHPDFDALLLAVV